MATTRRLTLIATIVALGLLGGCFGAVCGSGSPADQTDEKPGATGTKGQGVSPSAGTSNDLAPEPAREDDPAPKPGWSIELGGAATGTLEGPVVMQKHLGQYQAIQLTGRLHTEGGSRNRMTFSVANLESEGTGTYNSALAKAYFGEHDLGCGHPGETLETNLQVEVTDVDEAGLQGNFRGRLECKHETDEGEEEIVELEVSGKFVER